MVSGPLPAANARAMKSIPGGGPVSESTSQETSSDLNERRLLQITEMYAGYRKKHFPFVDDIDAPDALKMTQQDSSKVVFVDVRSPQETAVSTIPGAASEEAFLRDLRAGAIDNTTAIVYCTIGMRSGKFVAQHAEDGKAHGVRLLNLRGSVLAWTHAGGDLVRPSDKSPTKDVHVYAKPWDLARVDYTPHFLAKKGFVQACVDRIARWCA